MTKRIFYALYSKSAVVEFEEKPKVRQQRNWIEKTGAIRLRFATLRTGENHQELFAQMTPMECYKFYVKALKILKGQSSQEEVFIHRNNDQENASTKRLLIEKWERNGRKGYSLVLLVTQGEERKRINVACSGDELLSLTDWMKSLNSLLRYKEVIKVEEEEGGNELPPRPSDTDDNEEIPVEEDLPDDIF